MEYLPTPMAIRYYQDFKFAVVSHLPQADFTLDDQVIKDWIACNIKEEDSVSVSEK